MSLDMSATLLPSLEDKRTENWEIQIGTEREITVSDTFSEILNVLIPKPTQADLKKMYNVQKNIENLNSQLAENNEKIRKILDKIS